MKRSFLFSRHRLLGFALILAFGMASFTGCDNAIGPAAETAALDAARIASDAAGSGDLETVTITGPLAVVDGAGDLCKSFAVLYQGNPWFVKDLSRFAASSGLAEGVIVTVTGGASPVLDRDGEGNSLFYGYSLKAEEGPSITAIPN